MKIKILKRKFDIQEINLDIEKFEQNYIKVLLENQQFNYRYKYLECISYGRVGGKRLHRFLMEYEDKTNELIEQVLQGATQDLIQFTQEKGTSFFDSQTGKVDENLIEDYWHQQLVVIPQRKELQDWDRRFEELHCT